MAEDAVLDEFFDYKNKLMRILCTNEKIVRLVTDSSEAPVPNHDLPYSQIFPFEYLPETIDDGLTFICFDVDIEDVPNSTICIPVMYIYIFSHKSKLRLESGGIRNDELSKEINREINGSRDFGLGELDFKKATRFAPAKDYQGRILMYIGRDFNRVGVKKKAPANRKHHV